MHPSEIHLIKYSFKGKELYKSYCTPNSFDDEDLSNQLKSYAYNFYKILKMQNPKEAHNPNYIGIKNLQDVCSAVEENILKEYGFNILQVNAEDLEIRVKKSKIHQFKV